MLVSLFVLWGALSPLSLAALMQSALGSTIANFGWFYLLSMFGFLVFALYLAFGRFGSIRLGGEDAEPDFSQRHRADEKAIEGFRGDEGYDLWFRSGATQLGQDIRVEQPTCHRETSRTGIRARLGSISVSR